MSDMNDYERIQQERQSMANLLSDLDSIEEGKDAPIRLSDGSTFTNDFKQINRQETRNLLHSLNDVIEYGNLHQEDAAYYDQGGFLGESDDLSSIYGNYIPQEGEDFIPDPTIAPPKQVHNTNNQQSYQASSKPYVQGKNWIISEESVFGMKSAKVYSIKHALSNQIIMDNIMMQESALALAEILNQGRSLTDPKVLGIISSGIQYTAVVTEAINAAKKRQKVLKESRYDKAQELDLVIAEHKEKANQLKERVLNFLYEEGFITK